MFILSLEPVPDRVSWVSPDDDGQLGIEAEVQSRGYDGGGLAKKRSQLEQEQ